MQQARPKAIFFRRKKPLEWPRRMVIGRVQRHRRHSCTETSHERSHLVPKRGHSAESYPLVGADEINAIYLSIPLLVCG